MEDYYKEKTKEGMLRDIEQLLPELFRNLEDGLHDQMFQRVKECLKALNDHDDFFNKRTFRITARVLLALMIDNDDKENKLLEIKKSLRFLKQIGEG